MVDGIPPVISAYHRSGKSLVCELDVQPWGCEFWPETKLSQYNAGYEVPINAPGYFGFASNGGSEMFALSPKGSVVCLPFIVMSPADQLVVAPSWEAFERMLRPAVYA